MAEKKYCPINSHPKSDGMCKEKKCALWMWGENCCSLKSIAEDLNHISNHSMFRGEGE